MRNELKWPLPDKAVSEEQVILVGSKLGVSFPKDYINCAMINNGSAVIPYIFDVQGRNRVFGTLLSYDQSSNDNIEKVLEGYKDTLPKEIIPIAYDPAGNLICFDYKDSDSNPIIVFWEHENAGEKALLMQENGISAEEAQEVARENLYFVANSFTEFLEKLHD